MMSYSDLSSMCILRYTWRKILFLVQIQPWMIQLPFSDQLVSILIPNGLSSTFFCHLCLAEFCAYCTFLGGPHRIQSRPRMVLFGAWVQWVVSAPQSLGAVTNARLVLIAEKLCLIRLPGPARNFVSSIESNCLLAITGEQLPFRSLPPAIKPTCSYKYGLGE